MNNRKIYNMDNELIDVEVIRYFENNDNEYLIYSLNEFDEAGYTKLYIAKKKSNYLSIIEDSDDGEWDLIKGIIKEIIKNNRDGIDLQIIDLNEEKLEDLVLKDSRIFKLQGNLVNLLQENKNVIEPIIEEKCSNLIDEFDDEIIDDINYEQMYKKEKEKNDKLTGIISKMESILNEVEDNN